MKKRAALAPLALLVAAAPPSSALAAAGSAAAESTSRDRFAITVRRDGEPIIEGSGRMTRAVRAAGRFAKIEVEGPSALEVRVGPEESVEVEADDNLLDLITTDVDGDRLRVGTRGSFRTHRTPTVRVTLRELDRVSLRGSGDAHISNIASDRLELVLLGSGDLHAQGRARAVESDLYGSGNMDLAALSAPIIEASLYGTGEIRVHATRTLSAAVFGTGRIAVSGNPRFLRRDVFGPGSIASIGR
ncbi:MAG TPA: head GIN domain-containing protein [Allosphingosinicella sp.]